MINLDKVLGTHEILSIMEAQHGDDRRAPISRYSPKTIVVLDHEEYLDGQHYVNGDPDQHNRLANHLCEYKIPDADRHDIAQEVHDTGAARLVGPGKRLIIILAHNAADATPESVARSISGMGEPARVANVTRMLNFFLVKNALFECAALQHLEENPGQPVPSAMLQFRTAREAHRVFSLLGDTETGKTFMAGSMARALAIHDEDDSTTAISRAAYGRFPMLPMRSAALLTKIRLAAIYMQTPLLRGDEEKLAQLTPDSAAQRPDLAHVRHAIMNKFVPFSDPVEMFRCSMAYQTTFTRSIAHQTFPLLSQMLDLNQPSTGVHLTKHAFVEGMGKLITKRYIEAFGQLTEAKNPRAHRPFDSATAAQRHKTLN